MADLYIINPSHTRFINETPIITVMTFVHRLDFITDQINRYYKKIYWMESSGLSCCEYSQLSSCDKAEKIDHEIPSIKPGDRVIIPLRLNSYIVNDIFK